MASIQSIKMEAEIRTPGTKNDARRLRAKGRLPAVLYGANKPAVPLTLDPKPLEAVLNSESSHNKILNLKVAGGETISAVLQDWLHDPVSGALLHVDFKRIALDQKLRTKVPVHAVGEAKGVKVQGGIFEFVLREVEVECLPSDIPERIDADVSELVIGKNLRVRDLVVDPKVRIVSGSDKVVAHIVYVKEEEEKPAEEVAAAAVPAEPEVIKRGKGEEEGEEGEAPVAGKAEAKPEGKPEKAERKPDGKKK
jgi:large subunit ribosomal protein L25